MQRRGGLAPGELVPPASACDETIATTGAGVVTGRSRAYIPYEAESNCDFSGASEQLPLALAIDGTGHDKGSDAAKHSVHLSSPLTQRGNSPHTHDTTHDTHHRRTGGRY
jgi:hypothetical protein